MDNNGAGISGTVIAFISIALFVITIDAYKHDDGTQMKLAPILAIALGIFTTDQQEKPSFRPEGAFELTEKNTIVFFGSVSIFLGFIAVLLGFVSIYKNELTVISFSSLALGLGPVILFNIKVAILVVVVIGCAALCYKQQRSS